MPQTYASVEGFSSSWYTVEVCQTKREAMLLVNLLNGGGLNSTVTEYKLSKQVRPFGAAGETVKNDQVAGGDGNINA
jgi:hypothetical protein